MSGVDWDWIAKAIYLEWAGRRVGRVARRAYRLDGYPELRRGWDMPSHPFEELAAAAEAAGVVPSAECDALVFVDFLVRGRMRSGEEVYVVVASDRPTVREVSFARRMGTVPRQAVDSWVEVMVVGEEITEETAEAACWGNVRVVREVVHV